ncbi:hypothetical protein QTP88_028049 [Uroleucon formosanum]
MIAAHEKNVYHVFSYYNCNLPQATVAFYNNLCEPVVDWVQVPLQSMRIVKSEFHSFVSVKDLKSGNSLPTICESPKILL